MFCGYVCQTPVCRSFLSLLAFLLGRMLDVSIMFQLKDLNQGSFGFKGLRKPVNTIRDITLSLNFGGIIVDSQACLSTEILHCAVEVYRLGEIIY